MRKNISLLLISLFLILITGCSVVEGEVSDRIVSPENNNIPISGKWETTHIYDDGLIPFEDDDTIEEQNIEAYKMEAFFHREGVIMGESFTEDPSFRIKNVRAYDYLSQKYRIIPEDIGMENDRIEVITVINEEDTSLLDLIRFDEETILTEQNDIIYILEKVSEEASVDEVNRYIQVQKDILKSLGTEEDEEVQTGVLLGLKIPIYDEKSNNIDWDYKTVWINSNNGNVTSIYELDKLLLPRKNGFWEIEKERLYSGQSVNDTISATPLFKIEENNNSNGINSTYNDIGMLEDKEIESEIKNVLFIGNDYISVENIDLNNNEKQTLAVYAIDRINEETPIKLSDLIGENGRELFIEGARSEMSLMDSMIPNDENIGLFRREGHWSLRGRINYLENEEELYKDFNVRAIPPTEMVSFDERIVSYDMVNLVVPGLVDFFSSPNSEYIVALTNSHLIIYPVEDGDLIKEPNVRFEIPNDASVIMAEWSRGRYTEIWEEEVIENGGVEIEIQE